MNLRQRIALLLTLALLGGMLSACNNTTSPTAPPATNAPATPPAATPAATEPAAVQVKKTFRYSDGGDPIILDVGKAADNLSGKVFYYTLVPLMRGIESTQVPEGAVSFEVSSDGLTITYKLRQGMVWSDGQPLTSQDYAYSFLHMLDPDSANMNANNYYAVVGAQDYNMGEGPASAVGVATPDDLTLVFTLASRAPTQLTFLHDLNPVREDYVEKYGMSYGTSAEAYIGCGAYNLLSWEYEQKLEFAKNPLYWDADAINITDIVWVTVTDTNTMMNLFDTGAIDMMSVTPAFVATYANEINIPIERAAGNTLQLNFSNPENPEAG